MMNISPTTVILIIVVCLLIAIVIIGIQVTKISGALSGSRKEVKPAPAETEAVESGQTEEETMQWVDTQMDKTRLYCRPDCDLKTAAEMLRLSQRRLARLLKSQPQYGTFAEYLTQKRLEAACRLLREKPFYKIESVAHEVGFSSRKTFQTLFKNRMGITPSAYRDQAKTENLT